MSELRDDLWLASGGTLGVTAIATGEPVLATLGAVAFLYGGLNKLAHEGETNPSYITKDDIKRWADAEAWRRTAVEQAIAR